MSKIKVAIVGVGNCTSSFVQGLEFYKKNNTDIGLINNKIGEYSINDIEVVAAFDINELKIDKDLSEAIFASPNIAYRCPDIQVPKLGVEVKMGPVLDGNPPHLAEFIIAAKKDLLDVEKELQDSGAEILLNFLPTGSAKAARYYADIAIKKLGIGYINGMPELIVSGDDGYAEAAEKSGSPLIGDDVKSQIGATIINRALIELFKERGIHITKMYQLNYAGNTDFCNLVNRGESKIKTKTEALTTAIPYEANVSTGFSFIPNMGDRKTAIFKIEGQNYSGAPLVFEAKLEVEDSPNFGGVIADAVRYCKLALDRGTSGILTSACAFLAKHPPVQYNDKIAKEMLEQFVAGKRKD